MSPTDQDPASYLISVASAAIIPGCGKPGDTIHFTINGEPANETAVWQAIDIPLPDPNAPPRALILPPAPAGVIPPVLPSNRATLYLSIGKAFAWWLPIIDPQPTSFEEFQSLYIEAFIDGVSCGRADRPGNPHVFLVVPSREIKPGCGYEGATVALSVNGAAALFAGATWHAGYQDYLPIHLQPPPGLVGSQPGGPSGSAAASSPAIRPPDTGDAGLAWSP